MEWSVTVDEADWILPRLGPWGLVASVVPTGFAAYARVLHRVWRRDDGRQEPVKWADLAAWSGLPLRTESQFHDVALPRHRPTEPPPWDGDPPAMGTLDASEAHTLTEILLENAPRPMRWWFGVWVGYGWDSSLFMTSVSDSTSPVPPARVAPDPVPAAVRSGPRLRLPHREYLLYSGRPADALVFLDSEHQTPTLWWPDDHSWFVGSEIDLYWTYVAGTSSLIDRLLADPRLEAQPVSPGDSCWRTVPEWVSQRAQEAATDLLRDGQVHVELSLGAVWATFQAGSPGRRPSLEVETRGWNGSRSSADGPVSVRRDERLSDALAHRLAEGILALVS